MQQSDNAKAIAALRKCEDSVFWRVSAYVIIAPNTQTDCSIATDGLAPIKYGKIKVCYPKEGQGRLQAFVWDCSDTGLQYGAATGYGYDKLSAALSGLKFDDITFQDQPSSWERQLRDAGYTVIQAI